MKVKELSLASILIAFLIAQNYILYSFPITLTYLTLYILSNKIKSKEIVIFSVLTFVAVKNMIYAAFPTTIIFDIIGLLAFVFIARIPNKWIRYISMFLMIILHVLMLDFSFAILTGSIIAALIANITTGFLTYIYAPLSIVLIGIFDGIEIISNYQVDEKK